MRFTDFVHTLANDAHYVIRQLRRSPGFSVLVALTLALGIGPTTAILTVVNGVLFRPLPYPDADRLVYVSAGRAGASPYGGFAYTRDYAAWSKYNRSFRGIAGYIEFSANFAGAGDAERINGGLATESLFPLLGVRPQLGRRFLPQEDRPGAPPVVMLEHGFWQRHFGGDRSVVGKQVKLDGHGYTIVGVLPPNFRIPDQFGGDGGHDLWAPLVISETGVSEQFMLRVVGRLTAGTSTRVAQADLSRLSQGQFRKGVQKVISVVPWHEQVASRARRSLLIFVVAVGCVLLVACVNVANLLLVRGASREKEIAVRRALGARSGRIVQQLFIESLLIAFLGGASGVALAWAGKKLLLTLIAPMLPAMEPIGLDARVLDSSLALAVLTGIAFGLVPALQATRVRSSESLTRGGRGTGDNRASARLRSGLVVVEVAAAMLLLSGAGLLLHSFLNVQRVAMGFSGDRVLSFMVNLTPVEYPKPSDEVRFIDNTLERLRHVPGVQAAAAGSCLPLTGSSFTFTDMRIEGHPEALYDIGVVTATPGYFDTMSIPLLAGRDFNANDDEGAPKVAIVNQAFARRFFPEGTVLGRRILSRDPTAQPLTVAGVVGDVRAYPEETPEPAMYVSHRQAEGRMFAGATVVLRTAGNPLNLAPAVRQVMAGVDKTQPVFSLQTFDERRSTSIAPRRVGVVLAAAFATLALVLGAVGIYGVLAHAVSRRTREIGIRMAVGAPRYQILTMVLRKGMGMLGVGAVLGLIASIGLMRLVASELWGVSTYDPVTYLGVLAVLGASGVAACWLPAHRATRIDPNIALRCE
jgi:putative ABC transport system permease protein